MSDSLRTTSLPRRSSSASISGWTSHPHLAAAGEDVDRAVVVGVEEGAVGGRRLGELVDLLAQRGDVLLGLLQGEGELLVLGDGLGQLALGLEQPLLEGLDPAGALLQSPAEDGDLFLGGPGACRAACSRSSLSIGSSSSVGIRAVIGIHLVGIASFVVYPCWRPYTGALPISTRHCRADARRLG